MRYVDGYKMMDPKAMPFDPTRMVCGGFKILVDL